MDEKGRGAVLYAVAYGPAIGLRVTVSYLKMKRAARRAEKKFYQELLRSGLPQGEAKDLANEYGSSVSLRRIIGENGLFGRR